MWQSLGKGPIWNLEKSAYTQNKVDQDLPGAEMAPTSTRSPPHKYLRNKLIINSHFNLLTSFVSSLRTTYYTEILEDF